MLFSLDTYKALFAILHEDIFLIVPLLRVRLVQLVSLVLTASKFLFPLKAVLAVNRMPALPTFIDVELSGGGHYLLFYMPRKTLSLSC